MAAILKEDPPDIAASNARAPPALDADRPATASRSSPEERFQSARDLRLRARGAVRRPDAVAASRGCRRVSRWRRALVPRRSRAALAIAVGALAVALRRPRRRAAAVLSSAHVPARRRLVGALRARRPDGRLLGGLGRRPRQGVLDPAGEPGVRDLGAARWHPAVDLVRRRDGPEARPHGDPLWHRDARTGLARGRRSARARRGRVAGGLGPGGPRARCPSPCLRTGASRVSSRHGSLRARVGSSGHPIRRFQEDRRPGMDVGRDPDACGEPGSSRVGDGGARSWLGRRADLDRVVEEDSRGLATRGPRREPSWRSVAWTRPVASAS